MNAQDAQIGSCDRPSGASFASALVVSLLVALLTVPLAWSAWALLPDSIDYLGIANSWVNGSGFVDPVKCYYYLQAPVPQPGFAVSPPLVSLLAAIPLAMGGGITTIQCWHAGAAALVVGGIVLVATRMTSLASAIAAALLFGLSPAWLWLASIPLSDVLGAGILLVVLATARGVTASIPRAVLCAVATVAAWAIRPNLGALFVAVLAVTAWELGPRRALRRPGPWAYLSACVGCYLAIDRWVRLQTGHAPYVGYGFMSQILTPLEPLRYRYKYVGTWRFVSEHTAEIARAIIERSADLFHALFIDDGFLFAGWLVSVGVVYCLVSKGRGSFERRLSALCAVGFSVIVVLSWGAFAPKRYPIPVVLCGILCGMALVDDLLEVAIARFNCGGQGIARTLGKTTPVSAVLLLFLLHGGTGRLAESGWALRFYLRGGLPRDIRGQGNEADARYFCPFIRKGALVASSDPWSLHLLCGNPAIHLPSDLVGRPMLQSKFLRRENPEYLVAVADDPRSAWLADSGGLRLIGRHGGAGLFENVFFERAPGDRWQQPPPLACAGRPPDCLRAVAR